MTNAPSNAMAFCVKCKAQRLVHQARVEMVGTRRALKGVCVSCGTKVNKFLGKE